ncbi:alcohol dehydrogenase [Gluconobacter morbifer]|uniref:Alcohol dehydrogenase 15 kDa subunit n=1 Tax=Gluconobacter morbifer G707 TaxID=1088869 RepID=G6XJQ7_9PROT|nr:alcohol dehydrogenase [Gluconobacter morbifer]EHH67869.1 alcohol dehydrogenase 15 kDa subunit [Gluconobacter morbifer G707]
MFRRIVPVLGLALGLGLVSTAAMAQDDAQTVPPPPAVKGTPGKDFSSVSPTNLAGIMNYCIEEEYVSYDEGNPVLYGLAEKYKATEQTVGNYDYALGTAGYFNSNGKQYYLVAYTNEDDRRAACHAALQAAQPML